MLVEFPVLFSAALQQLVLVLNTTLLIAVLAVSELADVTWLPQVKKQLRDFYPLIAVLVIILIVAIIKQVSAK